MERKALPIGYEDIKEIIDKDLYYVDKSMLIRELLDSGGKVSLLTRPRRFGKTLNLSMLRRFFEDERTQAGKKVDNGYIFEGLAISSCGEKYLQHQQQYPVINLSLKSAKQENYDDVYLTIKKQISAEFHRHSYVLQGESLSEIEKEQYRQIEALQDEDNH